MLLLRQIRKVCKPTRLRKKVGNPNTWFSSIEKVLCLKWSRYVCRKSCGGVTKPNEKASYINCGNSEKLAYFKAFICAFKVFVIC